VWLNDRLCRDVAFCDSFEDLLDRARTLNEEIPRRFAGCEPLNIPWQLAGKATTEKLLGLLVLEALDHIRTSTTLRIMS
jgi:hypothetical protein